MRQFIHPAALGALLAIGLCVSGAAVGCSGAGFEGCEASKTCSADDGSGGDGAAGERSLASGGKSGAGHGSASNGSSGGKGGAAGEAGAGTGPAGAGGMGGESGCGQEPKPGIDDHPPGKA
jgi:hypothetical protein